MLKASCRDQQDSTNVSHSNNRHHQPLVVVVTQKHFSKQWKWEISLHSSCKTYKQMLSIHSRCLVKMFSNQWKGRETNLFPSLHELKFLATNEGKVEKYFGIHFLFSFCCRLILQFNTRRGGKLTSQSIGGFDHKSCLPALSQPHSKSWEVINCVLVFSIASPHKQEWHGTSSPSTAMMISCWRPWWGIPRTDIWDPYVRISSRRRCILKILPQEQPPKERYPWPNRPILGGGRRRVDWHRQWLAAPLLPVKPRRAWNRWPSYW